MKVDKDLMARCGKESPFKIPEGYFEHFHEQIMNNLPEPEVTVAPTKKTTIIEHIKPWLYMAAMFVSTIFVVQSLIYVQKTQFPAEETASIEEIYTEEVDLFMYSSLYNEYALYSYLTTGDNY